MTWVADNLPKNKHCFFGSQGGVSKGFYESLNVNIKSMDDKENIRRNMEIVADYFNLPPETLNILNQGVSANVVFVEEPSQFVLEADGAVTDKKGIVLCIKTADCAPVLLADYENGVIGAAHAGWRGAINGVIENTVDLMLKKGASIENISAAVGPCIAQESYEVDNDFYQNFLCKDAKNEKYFNDSKKEGFYLFDLESFCRDRLLIKGVRNVLVSGHDTYARDKEYFSFRRFTHKGQILQMGDFPTEISTITL